MALLRSDVSAVVCTLNSIKSIEACLLSLKKCGVGEIIVVDASSKDGTREVAETLSNTLLKDPGRGLGSARNMGIAISKGTLVLNIGSDNVLDPDQLEIMIRTLEDGGYAGVGAQTRVEGSDYLAKGMNAWWRTRFLPGPAQVIGTPSLFRSDILKAEPFDTKREHSDDSELCERWSNDHGSRFAISEAIVLEVGKNEWSEIALRCRNYGVSDYEIFTEGLSSGWEASRKLHSLCHPIKVDFMEPLFRLPVSEKVIRAPFLALFTTLRYTAWLSAALSQTTPE